MENWSNDACLGYVVKALKELGYSDSDIKNVVGEMKYWFDMKTVSEAEKIYSNSSF